MEISRLLRNNPYPHFYRVLYVFLLITLSKESINSRKLKYVIFAIVDNICDRIKLIDVVVI